jgi:hypothetical protein
MRRLSRWVRLALVPVVYLSLGAEALHLFLVGDSVDRIMVHELCAHKHTEAGKTLRVALPSRPHRALEE